MNSSDAGITEPRHPMPTAETVVMPAVAGGEAPKRPVSRQSGGIQDPLAS
jgi:hypothetical protein